MALAAAAAVVVLSINKPKRSLISHRKQPDLHISSYNDTDLLLVEMSGISGISIQIRIGKR